MEFVANFQPSVEYVQGRYNPANVLSRSPQSLFLALPDKLGLDGHGKEADPVTLGLGLFKSRKSQNCVEGGALFH